MDLRGSIAGISLLAALAAAPPAAAGEPALDFSAGAGYQYDSNVNVAAIDANSGASDTALVMDLGLDGSISLGQRWSMDVGYAYSGTRYRRLSDFDLALHHLRAALGYRIAGFDSGLSVDRFSARLDDASFLDITRVSPSLSRMFGDRLYVRGAYASATKRYANLPGRDAVNESLRADVYWLLDGMERYFAVALEGAAEDAASAELDYDSVSTKVTYGQRLEAGARGLDLKAHVQLENRDYRPLPDAGEEPRRDERFRAGLGLTVPFGEHFDLTGRAEYADHASTLEAATYDEMVYTLSVGAGF